MDRKMTINFVTPPMGRTKFTGGMYCIMKYADGLARRGHKVRVIPQLRSKRPEWINCEADIVLQGSVPAKGDTVKEKLNTYMDQKLFRKKNLFVKQGINLNYMQHAIPEADFTIATAWTTAETVHRFGTGKKIHFMQHFEPVFHPDPDSYDKYLCAWTYFLPTIKIANSSWLQETVKSYLSAHGIEEEVHKCINAVDLEIYRRDDRKTHGRSPSRVKVISYGGRGVRWKGFDEMVEAVALARKTLPDIEIEWLVYGDASQPPNNSIAPYNGLGFLQPPELAKAYNEADILLSASWYESFPLFPIEAMACGLATITTLKGTEDYAIHERTAHIVDDRNPHSIADGLKILITDEQYRKSLSAAGNQKAQEFSWGRSINTMEDLLSSILEKGTHRREQSWYDFTLD